MTATFEHPDNNDRGDKETKGLMDFVADHDKSHTELQTILKGIIDSPEGITYEAAQVLNLRANEVVATWRRITRNLLQSNEDTSGFVTSLATLWMKDEQDRAHFLNSEIGEDTFTPVCDGDTERLKQRLKKILAEIKENIEEEDVPQAIVEVFTRDYAGCIETDMQKLQAILQVAQYENRQEPEVVTSSWQDRIKALLPKLGAHALDVAKLAAGVGIGVAIGSRLGRRSQ